MTRAAEWFASLLVVLGVVGIAFGIAYPAPWAALAGVMLLTFGIRLTIDAARGGRP